MSLILKIYDPETREVKKEYTAETADIFFGSIEDILEKIDMEKLNDKMEWAKVIIVSIKQLRPILKDVFHGVTDEELKYTKVAELVPLFKEIFSFMLKEINIMGGVGAKN